MRYGLTVKTVPAKEPVTTADAKQHARVTVSDDDSYIDALVLAARQRIEEELQRALITTVYTMTLDHFPHWSAAYRNESAADLSLLQSGIAQPIYLPRSPVQSVDSIKYIDDEGTQQTLAASKYRVDSNSLVARITPAYGESWPTPRLVTNAVEIEFTAGYGDDDADVPEPIRQAIRMLIATHYDVGRSAVIAGSIAMQIPKTVDYLLGPYRVGTQANP